MVGPIRFSVVLTTVQSLGGGLGGWQLWTVTLETMVHIKNMWFRLHVTKQIVSVSKNQTTVFPWLQPSAKLSVSATWMKWTTCSHCDSRNHDPVSLYLILNVFPVAMKLYKDISGRRVWLAASYLLQHTVYINYCWIMKSNVNSVSNELKLLHNLGRTWAQHLQKLCRLALNAERLLLKCTSYISQDTLNHKAFCCWFNWKTEKRTGRLKLLLLLSLHRISPCNTGACRWTYKSTLLLCITGIADTYLKHYVLSYCI